MVADISKALVPALVYSEEKSMRYVFAALALVATLQVAGPAVAQNYPDRLVTMVVPFAAGGATDAIARALASQMSKGLGQQIVVENHAGAAGAIGANMVAKAAPNGYTILMSTTSTHVILPLTQRTLGYDPLKSFVSIGLAATAPNMLIVSPKVPANSVTELIEYAKQNPDKINFASSGQGTITHLIGQLFVMQAGISAQHVPYKSGVQSFAELNGGQIHFLFDSIVWSLPQIRDGKLKGLAVTSAKRSSLAPDIPTVAESGLPNFEGVTWFGLSAPAATPDVVIARLQSDLKAALADKGLIERLAVLGAEPAIAQGPEFTQMIIDDTQKWGEVVRKAGLQTP
jgi:tripartite-type tricarboxylate transporter receptor subunit TctC